MDDLETRLLATCPMCGNRAVVSDICGVCHVSKSGYHARRPWEVPGNSRTPSATRTGVGVKRTTKQEKLW